MYKKAFVLTTQDTGCPHSWTVSNFDADIIVPCEDKTYQYLITTESSYETQIIVARILEAFYVNDVQSCEIKLLNVPTSRKIETILKLLSCNNKITVQS